MRRWRGAASRSRTLRSETMAASSAWRCASRDITDRHRAEEADARLAAIVESSDDAILSKTLDGTIVTWNRGAERLYGYAAEEIVGKSVAMLMPNGSNGELATLLGRIRGGGSVEHYETVRVRKDGSPVEVSLSLSAINDDAGVLIGASTIARDITERKQAEEALRKSEAMLTTAESVAQLGSWRWDLSTGRVTWSQGMFRLFAVDSAGLDVDWTKVLRERVHPDDLAAAQKATASMQECGVPVPVEYRLRLPDGSERVVRGEGEAERDAAGQVVAVVGYYQDVTERRNAEASLRESEQRFRGLVENISDVISSYDLDLRYRYLSPSFSRLMGIDAQSFIGKTHREAGLSEELADVLDAGLTRALESGKPVDLEFMMVGVAGEAVAEARIFPEFDQEGRPTGVVTVTHDVTARRHAEKEIQLARQRLALHVEQTPLAVIEFDLDGARVRVESGRRRVVRLLARGCRRATLVVHRARGLARTHRRDLGSHRRAERRWAVDERQHHQGRADHQLRMVQHRARRPGRADDRRGIADSGRHRAQAGRAATPRQRPQAGGDHRWRDRGALPFGRDARPLHRRPRAARERTRGRHRADRWDLPRRACSTCRSPAACTTSAR